MSIQAGRKEEEVVQVGALSGRQLRKFGHSKAVLEVIYSLCVFLIILFEFHLSNVLLGTADLSLQAGLLLFKYRTSV